MQIEEFNQKANKAIEELKAAKPKEAMIIHHDDADGLCSAAITKKALTREGIKVKTFCLEKVYTEVIEDLHSKHGQTIFYVDLGSPHADLISEYNKGRNLTIILDHHDPRPSKDPKVLDLNLEHFGFKGETDFFRSTMLLSICESSEQRQSRLKLSGSCRKLRNPTRVSRNKQDDFARSPKERNSPTKRQKL